ncbi:MAG: winged helix-turn-helix domain-containing protein [Bacteriovoracaceae bacterium]|nr:winged helix-turn-helix domain-containing protein [Bacteriovoracaceae bacterium]
MIQNSNQSGTAQKSDQSKMDSVIARATLNFKKDDSYVANYEDEDRVQGQGYYRLAKVYYDKSDLNKAEEFFIKSLERTQFPRDAFAMFKIHGFLIRIYSESLQESKANHHIQSSEMLLEKLASSLGTLNAEYFYNLGVVNTYKGDFRDARKNFMLSYKKAQEEHEPELVSKSLFALATNYYNTGEFDLSLTYLKQLDELLNILRKDYLKGSMYILFGHVYSGLNKLAESLDSYHKAIRTLQGKTSWNLYSYILLYQGVVYKKLGEFTKALIFFNLAKNSIDERNFKRLKQKIAQEVDDVNDSSVDLYLDRNNRVIHEKNIGTIDFKHRFVLLEILFLLARNPGQYFNKDDLAKLIWKDEYNPLIHDKLIYTSVSRLRKLIEPTEGSRKYIIRGKDGYTFNNQVRARFHKETETGGQKTIANVEISSPV